MSHDLLVCIDACGYAKWPKNGMIWFHVICVEMAVLDVFI